MTTPLRLGIAGLGTVGTGVVRIVRQKAALLKARTGRHSLTLYCPSESTCCSKAS